MKVVKILVPTFLLVTVLGLIASIFFWKNGYYVPWSRIPSNSGDKQSLIEYCKQELLEPLNVTIGTEQLVMEAEEYMKVSITVEDLTFTEWLTGDVPSITSTRVYDSDAVEACLRKLYKEHKDAFMYIENGKLMFSPHVLGCDFDVVLVRDTIMSNLQNSEFTQDLTDYCITPEVLTEDLQSSYDERKWINDWQVVYSDGTTIGTEFLLNYIDESFSLNPDEVNFKDVLSTLNKQYNTNKNSLEFTTSHENKITVPYYTYGFIVDDREEEKHLRALLKEHSSETNRVPERYGYDSFSNTYIEISLSDQHVWHYVSGELCCETDCVTGTKGSRDTPTGVFYVSEKIPGKYLKGEGYKTWVNRWMRLTNQGVGLHDAYWRHSFGGRIYEYNGSHGCINLPASYASKLYNEISRGIPVVIY